MPVAPSRVASSPRPLTRKRSLYNCKPGRTLSSMLHSALFKCLAREMECHLLPIEVINLAPCKLVIKARDICPQQRSMPLRSGGAPCCMPAESHPLKNRRQAMHFAAARGSRILTT
eukprot:scaffold1411_cov396-Prasinococcus_capsulatus_cf.AAC.24